MTAYGTVFNPTSTPQAVDDAGRVLGGGEWGIAHMAADVVRANLDANRLAAADVSASTDPDVKALAAQAKERSSRAAAFAKAGVEDLRDIAVDLEDGDEARAEARRVVDATPKAELVHYLTLSPDAVPPAASKE